MLYAWSSTIIPNPTLRVLQYYIDGSAARSETPHENQNYSQPRASTTKLLRAVLATAVESIRVIRPLAGGGKDGGGEGGDRLAKSPLEFRKGNRIPKRSLFW